MNQLGKGRKPTSSTYLVRKISCFAYSALVTTNTVGDVELFHSGHKHIPRSPYKVSTQRPLTCCTCKIKKKKKNPFTLFYIYHLWPGLHGCWLAAVNPRGWGFIACQVMKVCNISTLVKVLTSPVLKKKHTLSRYGVAENEIQFTFHEYIANVLWRYSVFIRSVSLIVLRKSVIQATLCFLNLV